MAVAVETCWTVGGPRRASVLVAATGTRERKRPRLCVTGALPHGLSQHPPAGSGARRPIGRPLEVGGGGPRRHWPAA